MILFRQSGNPQDGLHFGRIRFEQEYPLIKFFDDCIFNSKFQFAKSFVLLQLRVNRLNFVDETVDFPLHISPLGGQFLAVGFVDSIDLLFGFVQVNFEAYVFHRALLMNLVHLILLVVVDFHLGSQFF